MFISRSSVNIFPIKRIWILPILQVANLFFVVFQVMFEFVPYFWIIFLLIFWEGLLGGAVYTNAFYLIAQKVEARYLEFSLGVTSVADTIGIVLAGVSAIFVEDALRKYCTLCT